MNKEEIEQAVADRDWWRETAAIIDCILVGFTYRQAATLCLGG